ncbi:MAG: BON domain-containing protein [Bryobacteraceae bacterium]|jgi:osmotically-inducible protein OsmY
MNKLIGSLLVLSAVFCLILRADQPKSDDVIDDQIAIKLTSDPIVKGGSIKVDSQQGVVTLSGAVGTKKQKDRAASIAKKVKGVKQVQNDLVVEKTLNQ